MNLTNVKKLKKVYFCPISHLVSYYSFIYINQLLYLFLQMIEILGGGAPRESTTTAVGDKNTTTTTIGGVGDGERETEQPMAVD